MPKLLRLALPLLLLATGAASGGGKATAARPKTGPPSATLGAAHAASVRVVARDIPLHGTRTVSYTHLTLPTIYSV